MNSTQIHKCQGKYPSVCMVKGKIIYSHREACQVIPRNSQALMIIQRNMLNGAVPSMGLLTRKFLKGFLGPEFAFKGPSINQLGVGMYSKSNNNPL